MNKQRGTDLIVSNLERVEMRIALGHERSVTRANAN